MKRTDKDGSGILVDNAADGEGRECGDDARWGVVAKKN